MTEPIPSPSDVARNRRIILYTDIVSGILLVGTGALLFIARHVVTLGRLSTTMNIVAQACALGAAFLLVAALWKRPHPRAFLLKPIPSERESPEQLRAEGVERTLYWKLALLRPAIAILILETALTFISAVLPL